MSRTDMCSPHDLFESAFGISQLTIGPRPPNYSEAFGERRFENLGRLINIYLKGDLIELNEAIAAQAAQEEDIMTDDDYFFEVTYRFFKALFDYARIETPVASAIPPVYFYINELATMNFMDIIRKMEEDTPPFIISDIVRRKYEGDDGFLPANMCHILYLFQSKYKKNLSMKLMEEDDKELLKRVLQVVLLINVFNFYNTLQDNPGDKVLWQNYTKHLNLDNLHLDPITRGILEDMKNFPYNYSLEEKPYYEDWLQNYRYTPQPTKRPNGGPGTGRQRRKRNKNSPEGDLQTFREKLAQQIERNKKKDRKEEEEEKLKKENEEKKKRKRNLALISNIRDDFSPPFDKKKMDFKGQRNNKFSKLLLTRYNRDEFIDTEVIRLQDLFRAILLTFFYKLESEDIDRLRNNLQKYETKNINFTMLKYRGTSFMDLVEEGMQMRLQELENENEIIEEYAKLARNFIDTLKARKPDENEVRSSVKQFCDFAEENRIMLKELKNKLQSSILNEAFKYPKKLENNNILQLVQKIWKCVEEILTDASDTSSSAESQGEPQSPIVIDTSPSVQSEKETVGPDSSSLSDDEFLESVYALEDRQKKMDTRKKETQSSSSDRQKKMDTREEETQSSSSEEEEEESSSEEEESSEEEGSYKSDRSKSLIDFD